MWANVYLALGHADEVAGLERRHGLRERGGIRHTLNKSHSRVRTVFPVPVPGDLPVAHLTIYSTHCLNRFLGSQDFGWRSNLQEGSSPGTEMMTTALETSTIYL